MMVDARPLMRTGTDSPVHDACFARRTAARLVSSAAACLQDGQMTSRPTASNGLPHFVQYFFMITFSFLSPHSDNTNFFLVPFPLDTYKYNDLGCICQIRNKLKVCRRDSRHDSNKPTCASCYKAINTCDVIIRRLADVHGICNGADEQQGHKHDDGDDGDGGQNAGFHLESSFASDLLASTCPSWDCL